MREPKFSYGTWVQPTEKAFKGRIFPYSAKPVVGIVVWASEYTLRVHVRGHRIATNYHEDFWRLYDGDKD